jgi:CheY-like chemotaxis protein
MEPEGTSYFDVQSTMAHRNGKETAVSTPAAVLRIPSTLSIMVVEDNLINQRLLVKQLKKLGCKVMVANHGVECLDLLHNTRFGKNPDIDLSVVLLDWEMPVMDGLTCVRKIRELERDGGASGHVPVMGLTANARPAQLEKAIAAGMVRRSR